MTDVSIPVEPDSRRLNGHLYVRFLSTTDHRAYRHYHRHGQREARRRSPTPFWPVGLTRPLTRGFSVRVRPGIPRCGQVGFCRENALQSWIESTFSSSQPKCKRLIRKFSLIPNKGFADLFVREYAYRKQFVSHQNMMLPDEHDFPKLASISGITHTNHCQSYFPRATIRLRSIPLGCMGRNHLVFRSDSVQKSSSGPVTWVLGPSYVTEQ